jgi:hypothetical protein
VSAVKLDGLTAALFARQHPSGCIRIVRSYGSVLHVHGSCYRNGAANALDVSSVEVSDIAIEWKPKQLVPRCWWCNIADRWTDVDVTQFCAVPSEPNLE